MNFHPDFLDAAEPIVVSNQQIELGAFDINFEKIDPVKAVTVEKLRHPEVTRRAGRVVMRGSIEYARLTQHPLPPDHGLFNGNLLCASVLFH
jgi:hypothetical protein